MRSKRLLELMWKDKYDEFTVLLQQCTPEDLKQEVANSVDNILFKALYFHDARYFKALLDSKACDQSVLEWATTPGKRTILHDAIEEIKVKVTPKVEWILNHPRFKIEYLEKETSLGDTPIKLVITSPHPEALKQIINHPQCTAPILHSLLTHAVVHNSIPALKEIIEHPKRPEDTFRFILQQAIAHNKPDVLKTIMEHRDCPKDVFRFTETHTALHDAVKKPSPGVIKFIVQSKKIDTDFLRIKDDKGKTALDVAIEAGNVAVLKTLLESPHCTVDLIKAERLRGKANKTHDKEIIDLVKKHEGRDSYKKIYQSVKSGEDVRLLQAADLLRDYSTPWRYARFHWNRHHTEDVNQIIKEIDNGTISDIDGLVDRLNKLQDKLPNQTGSLSRRIEFIKKEFAHSEIEKGNDLTL
ncbi:DUF5617 domain-containing protein [Legionella parisiensis]|uniref:RavJ-like C-terminal domain-containing protein n=1 Tax=Legionella parisiensis TaxID=45071 RepID=A0A1E5JSA1_9GAMM|nr:DUF5617 domain-containing protein [Legionella parisiensis]KTD42139.1 ankyrin [Legionella parisiensis]OEH47397.1 hypothetical protein lpari_01565 [Legionella parisiensis]STX75310.1 ankyrin [Legionella parisiensis]